MPAIQLQLPPMHPGQKQVWESEERFNVLSCGRRWGKTHLGVLKCVSVAAKGGRAWWVAPTYPVGSIGWRLLRRLVQPMSSLPGFDKNESERRIVLPGGGEVQVKSADKPDGLRGEGLDYVVMDEAADVKPEAWYEALRPTLAERRGCAMFIGTPRGMDNWFYDIYRNAHEGKPGWRSWQRPTADNPYVPADEIEAAREEMGAVLFAQEFLAEFVVPGGSVLRPEWARYFVLAGDKQKYDADTILMLEHQGNVYEAMGLRGAVRFATVDLAASTRDEADYTVISSWAYTTKKNLCHLGQIRGRMEGPDIVPAIEKAFEDWKLSWVAVEKVGFQLALIQWARRAGVPVRAIRPDKDKLARAMLLAARMESQQVWFQKDAKFTEELANECWAFPRGRHDDQVDTAAYACDQVMNLATGPQLVSW